MEIVFAKFILTLIDPSGWACADSPNFAMFFIRGEIKVEMVLSFILNVFDI